MLDVKSKMTLDFEARRWKYAGTKETAIRDTFDETATRYYQRLNALIDDPEALAYSPVVVARLRRLRDQRSHLRADPSATETDTPPEPVLPS